MLLFKWSFVLLRDQPSEVELARLVQIYIQSSQVSDLESHYNKITMPCPTPRKD